jgi:hypothetical protein
MIPVGVCCRNRAAARGIPGSRAPRRPPGRCRGEAPATLAGGRLLRQWRLRMAFTVLVIGVAVHTLAGSLPRLAEIPRRVLLCGHWKDIP